MESLWAARSFSTGETQLRLAPCLQFVCYCEKTWYGTVRCRIFDAQGYPLPVTWWAWGPPARPGLACCAAHMRWPVLGAMPKGGTGSGRSSLHLLFSAPASTTRTIKRCLPHDLCSLSYPPCPRVRSPTDYVFQPDQFAQGPEAAAGTPLDVREPPFLEHPRTPQEVKARAAPPSALPLLTPPFCLVERAPCCGHHVGSRRLTAASSRRLGLPGTHSGCGPRRRSNLPSAIRLFAAGQCADDTAVCGAGLHRLRAGGAGARWPDGKPLQAPLLCPGSAHQSACWPITAPPLCALPGLHVSGKCVTCASVAAVSCPSKPDCVRTHFVQQAVLVPPSANQC